MTIATLQNALNTALLSEEQVSMLVVTSRPGMGINHTIRDFAKNADLSFLDIRTTAIDPIPLKPIIGKDETITKPGYRFIWNHLLSTDPVAILIDEVSSMTMGVVEKMIEQIRSQAKSKVLVILSGLTGEHGVPESLKQKFCIFEVVDIDVAEAFIGFLRTEKRSDMHLKVADFIEENGMMGETPKQWHLFAVAKEIGLKEVAACSLNSREVMDRFDAWIAEKAKEA